MLHIYAHRWIYMNVFIQTYVWLNPIYDCLKANNYFQGVPIGILKNF